MGASTRWAASPSAARSPRFRRSSTSWQTCTWASSSRGRTPTTGPGALAGARRELGSPRRRRGWLRARPTPGGQGVNIQVHGGMGFTWSFDCHSTTAGQGHRASCSAAPALEGTARHPLEAGRPRRQHGTSTTRGRKRRFARRCGSGSAPRGAKRGAFETWQSRYPGREGWEGLEARAAFQRSKGGGRLRRRCIWPAEWAGRALPPIYQVIYSAGGVALSRSARLLRDRPGMCMPTAFSPTPTTAERRYAPRRSARRVWCQLFSEPGAAPNWPAAHTAPSGPATTWVNQYGQKIWTLGAPLADWPPGPRASDPKTAKQKGLTSSSVHEVRRASRPAGQADLGASTSKEVYFTDRAHPDGPAPRAVGAGWGVAIIHAMKRAAHLGRTARPDLRGRSSPGPRHPARGRPAIANGRWRERLADL